MKRQVFAVCLLAASVVGWVWSILYCDIQCFIRVTNHISWAALVLTAIGMWWTAEVKERGTDADADLDDTDA